MSSSSSTSTPSASSAPALFQPVQIGDITLGHRVVLAPLTRFRADSAHVHTDMGVEYYRQRAAVRGTLLISEATYIAPQAGGMPNVPGIWNDAQIAAWKKITDAVHAKGSYIYLQLWALGRAARPAALKQENPDYDYVAPSPIALSTSPDDVPREVCSAPCLCRDQGIRAVVRDRRVQRSAQGRVRRRRGARRERLPCRPVPPGRVEQAHGRVRRLDREPRTVRARGHGGRRRRRRTEQICYPAEPLERIPRSGVTMYALELGDMFLVNQFKEKYPNLAFLHVVAPGAPGNRGPEDPSETDFIYDLWAPRPVIVTGGFDRDSGLRVAEQTGQIIGYGRAFLANPDLPFRLRENLALNEPEYDTFYLPMNEKGYTTYPFSKEFLETQEKAQL